MARDRYIFRRLDNDKLIEVDFTTMMSAELGYITLPDGVQAKRCVWLETEADQPKPEARHKGINTHELSLSLGFSQAQLADFEADRQRHGFTGVEFYPDPQVPGMVGVKCSSEAEKERYIEHRGYFNKTERYGRAMGKEDLEMARKLVRERYGTETEDPGPQG